MKTTKEEADKLVHDRQVEALNDLLVKNYDSENGYKEALLETENPHLKKYFKKQAAQRGQYINELDKALREPTRSQLNLGLPAGSMHRVWIDFKTALTGKSDESILEECIRGDKTAVEEYKEVLENNAFSDATRNQVQYQLNGIQNTLDTVRRLEDIVD